MQDELARIVAGLPVASLWPLTVPCIASSRLRVALVSSLSALYVLAPQLHSASSIPLLVAAVAVPVALRSPSAELASVTGTSGKRWLVMYSPVFAALLLGLAAVIVVDFEQGRDALERVIDSDRAALTMTGLIAAIFVGGSVVMWILMPFTRALRESGEASRLPGLAHAGRYIGWFERAVLFAFVIGGAPEAAAIALAAKSFARFPTLSEHHEGFAEYFLIGSLASLTVAVGLAAATRAALGLAPF